MLLVVAGGIILGMLMVAIHVCIAGIRGKIDVLDLVRGPGGRLSGSKIWTHIGKAVAVYAMVKDAASGAPSIELQAVLFALIAGHEVWKKYQNMAVDNKKGAES